MILGITGGSGCGKTTLLNLIREHGGLVLDCDAIYHELLTSNRELLAAINARFPGVVEGGTLDRKKLGTIVFADPAALSDLNVITHSAVKQEVLHRLSPVPKLAAIDAIALFEGGLAELCDATIAVTAPMVDRVRRLMARDGISAAYARARIAAQHDDAWFRAKCTYMLENSGTIDAFATNCLAFLESLGIMKP